MMYFIYFYDLIRIHQIPFFEVLKAFTNALKLDIATSCYILIPIFVIVLLQSIFNCKVFKHIIRVYNFILVICYALLIVGEMGIYPEWKTKVTYKALLYLAHPTEVLNSASTFTVFVLFGIAILLMVIGFLLYNKFVFKSLTFTNRKWWVPVALVLLFPALLVIGARGGLQQIPINQSQSYFSKYDLVNQGAVNTAFNLYISVFENKEFLDKNPFEFYNPSEAKTQTDSLFHVKKDTTISILIVPKPNIVLLILESWSADLIESIGGMPGITPEFRKLENEGLLFTNAFASGKRSEQAMSALFSGFPSTPYSSITVQPDKFVKLPGIIKKLKSDGYHTSFYFGGQLIYGNIKAFMVNAGFDRIKEIYDFKPGLLQGKLGIHDEFTLNEQLDDLENEKQPFFSSLFTLSSHSPYDQPIREKVAGGKNEHEYINSAYYTDWCLGRYFSQAKQKSWYNNTLFILVADHSHNTYNNWPLNSFEYNKIPVLICGGALKTEFRGTKFEKLMSQTDLPATILAQLGIEHKEFHYSRDLFNPYYSEFTYFTFDYGIGLRNPEGTVIWGKSFKQLSVDGFKARGPAKAEKNAKALLQELFQDYLDF